MKEGSEVLCICATRYLFMYQNRSPYESRDGPFERGTNAP